MRPPTPGRALNSEKLIVMTNGAATGWTGKLWAMHQGIERAAIFAPEFLWLTDADIAHSPDNLSRLVARAQSGNKVLVSLMARIPHGRRAFRYITLFFLRHAVPLWCGQ